MRKSAIALAVAGSFFASAAFADPTLEQRLEALQKQLDGMQQLQNEVNQIKQQLEQQKQQNQALAAQVEQSKIIADKDENESDSTQVGGYGEAIYSHYTKGDEPDSADLARFVLFFGHTFNDKLSFNSELEIEHAIASSEDAGEAELEQAYVNYRVSDAFNVKTGLFLIPLGILNETHEPPTFYGVRRNDVETRIIPTTWREGGIGLHGLLASGLQYDVGLTTGFDSGKLDDSRTAIRSGHQEMSEANANDLSVYAALNYAAMPGLLIGGGLFTGDTGQDGASNPLLEGVGARLTLGDAHVRYSVGGLELQALYARGTLGDASKVNAALLTSDEPFAAPKTFTGWYAQAAYHVWHRGDFDAAPFARYEYIDIEQLEDAAAGLFEDPANHEHILTAGVNFKVHPQVVFKADYQSFDTDESRNSFNLGVGYMF